MFNNSTKQQSRLEIKYANGDSFILENFDLEYFDYFEDLILRLGPPQFAEEPTDDFDVIAAFEERDATMADLKAAIQELNLAVATNETVTAGAITLINDVVAQLRDNANDAGAIQELADRLEASRDRLASALVVGTPAENAGDAELPIIADPVGEPELPAEAAVEPAPAPIEEPAPEAPVDAVAEEAAPIVEEAVETSEPAIAVEEPVAEEAAPAEEAPVEEAVAEEPAAEPTDEQLPN